MIFVLLLGLLGLRFGGVRGLFLGAILGYLLGRVVRSALRRGLGAVKEQFVESTFAVMGAVCKADGVVSRDEIAATEALFARLGLSPEQRAVAKAAFNRGKTPDFDLDAEVDRFARAARGSRVVHQMFLRVQMIAVTADGQVHPAETALLLRIARRLGYSDFELRQLEALLRAMAGGGHVGDAPPGAGASHRPPSRQRIEDAYATLGVSPEVSDAELKRVYRKLMRDNHPDRIAAQGLPESMRALAEERTREINAAYDLIKKARGTN